MVVVNVVFSLVIGWVVKDFFTLTVEQQFLVVFSVYITADFFYQNYRKKSRAIIKKIAISLFGENLAEKINGFIKKPRKNEATGSRTCSQKFPGSAAKGFDFAIYFDAPKNSAHHVTMWLPYLNEISEKYVIILRSKRYFKFFSDLDCSVILIKKINDLSVVEELGVSTVFYVNNGMRNTHLVRYVNLKHVQLLHGESDKPSSYNPVTNMYDYICVAGELGRERYSNNGVVIPDNKFRIVSRPQVEGLTVSENICDLSNITVFYATTWSGFHNDSDFSSIYNAVEIVSRLLALNVRIIFRPHPYSYQNKEQAKIIKDISVMLMAVTGRDHCISNNEVFNYQFPDVSDCIEASELLISDITSVLADWLYTQKPYMMMIDVDEDIFIKTYPLSAAAEFFTENFENFERKFKNVLTDENKFIKRKTLREKSLGVVGEQSPKNLFIAEVSDIVYNAPKSKL